MSKKRDRIIIIDGSSYIFRAFFALPGLSNSKGVPTNAVFGFVNMLMKVIADKKPGKILLAFDSGRASFRRDMYPEYKANREAAPEDLVEQFPLIFEAVDAFQVQRLAIDGVEADDIIGTVARNAEKEGYQVEIISGDKDLMQLVSDHTVLFDPMKDKLYNREAVFEKFQVYPEQIVDFLALMGDSSDNIPGVPGIGKKTAADLLGQYKSLDGIYENVESIKQKKRRETLETEKKKAYLSQSLTQLKLDVEIPFSWDDLEYTGADNARLQSFLQEMEFQNLLKKFDMEASPSGFTRGEAITVRTEEDLRAMLDELESSEVVAFDTETTSLHTQTAEMVGLSFCGQEGKAYYVPVGHIIREGDNTEMQKDQIDPERAKSLLRPLLEHPEIPKCGQNVKYDCEVLKRWDVDVKGVVSDTMLASYLLDSDQKHGLDAMAFRVLGHENISYDSVAGKGKTQVSFAEVEISKAADYAAEDAEVTWHLNQRFLPQIKEAGLEKLFSEIEVPLVSVLAAMEYGGVRVDQAALREMSETLRVALEKEEAEIYEAAGEKFNINSPKQLSKILFDKLKLPVIKKTKTGISTDESVLVKLSKDHRICEKILRFRGLGKLRSTYVEGLLAQVHPRTGKIHTSYNQTVAATGRLSSSDPNLQNIPVSGAEFDIRAMFIPEAGCEFLSADYSQVELRLLAHMSGDKELTRAFMEDEDVHSFTAKLIFGCEEADSEQRKIAKTINFGVIYGQTPYGLSQTLGISTSEAKDFIDRYFERYAAVKDFLGTLVTDARETGWAKTQLGRRRKVAEIDSKNRMRREMAERVAINMPIQGTAADMIKIAMIRIHNRLREEELQSRMVLQVHDELVFEVVEGEKCVMEKLVKEEMENALSLSVPLKVDIGWGKNWGECK